MPTTRLGGARSFRAPMLPFSNAPLGPEGDLDHLFAVGDRWGTTLAKLGGVNKGACGNGIRWPIPGSRGQLYRSVSGAFCGPVWPVLTRFAPLKSPKSLNLLALPGIS